MYPSTPDEDLETWSYRLDALALRRLSVSVTVTAPARFEEPVCCVVRGLMGSRLRDLRCTTRAPTCEGCQEATHCDFAHIIGAPEAIPTTPADARPFWLRGVPYGRSIARGQRFTASLVYLPAVLARWPHLCAALIDALEVLGRPDAPPNEVGVVDDGPVVRARAGRATAWRLIAESPWCLRGSLERGAQRCPEAPWLEPLASEGLQRVSHLIGAFAGQRTPRIALPDLSGVERVAGAVRPWEDSRFTHRQQQRVGMKGYEGAAVLRGAGVDALVPLLSALSLVGVGKGTSMGFGALRLEPVET